jgi:hypothetical protein
MFSEECKVTEGKGPARRVAEQTGQKTGNMFATLSTQWHSEDPWKSNASSAAASSESQ